MSILLAISKDFRNGRILPPCGSCRNPLGMFALRIRANGSGSGATQIDLCPACVETLPGIAEGAMRTVRAALAEGTG